MMILYVAQIGDHSNALGRMRALGSLGHEVVALHAHPPEDRLLHLVRGLRRRTGFGPPHPLGNEIIRAASQHRPDILWVDKGLNVSPAALRAIRREVPGVYCLHYSPDDAMIASNRSCDFDRSVSLYDVQVTTKANNVDFLLGMGAKKVVRGWKGFDPQIHFPPSESERERSVATRVLFIGAFEEERARTIVHLARNGVPVTVISNWKQWRSIDGLSGSIQLRDEFPFGRAYARLLGSAAVNLCFLRKAACDRHTQRSIEIPASGGVMLAERTDEHQLLFAEGSEAEFFETDEECLLKCRELLSSAERRSGIAQAARERCLASHYDWASELSRVLRDAGVAV